MNITSDTKRLFEKILYRGYSNDALNRGISEPSDDSNSSGWLFTTDKASHAEEFSQGQTTRGSEMIFEEYDIPDQDIEKLYDKKKDLLQIRKTMHKYPEIEAFLKSKGYIGYIDSDTVSINPDGGPYPQVVSRADEYVFFDKAKYKQFLSNRIETDNGEYSDDQIKFLEDRGLKRFQYERDEERWKAQDPHEQDPAFQAYLEEIALMEDMTEEEREDYMANQHRLQAIKKSQKEFDFN